MSELALLHNSAMELAAQADMLLRAGDGSAAQLRFRDAFEKEREAALALADRTDAEPTRSVLLRSAASLALDCHEPREAERLIAIGLAGNPPEEIAEELRDLYETATFRRHLMLRGIELDNSEFQMSLAGNGVGYGLIAYQDYVPRVQTVESLLLRTLERQYELPFRENRKPKKAVSDNYSFYLSAPRAASFAVTIRFGHAVKQLRLFDKEVDPVLEFLECIQLFAAEQQSELKRRIDNNVYYRNFIHQARKLAPDGERIKTVGFTTTSRGKERIIVMNSPPSESWYSRTTSRDRVVTEFIGTLHVAQKDDRYARRNLIGIREDNGASRTIIVPKGLMNDIVRPLWDRKVIAKCRQASGGKYTLVEIRPTDDGNEV